MYKPERPLGVTILAVLNALSGIFTLLVGIGFAALMALGMLAFLKETIREIEHSMPLAIPAGLIAGFLLIIIIILIVVGLVNLVIAWGLWTGKVWAWWLTVIFSGIGALAALANLGFTVFRFARVLGHPGVMVGMGISVGSNLVSLAIDLLIIWYFFRPHVKAFFGMGPSVPTPPPPPPATV